MESGSQRGKKIQYVGIMIIWCALIQGLSQKFRRISDYTATSISECI